jgi:hypothetical protein
LAETARRASIEIIRYSSVRDPHAGLNLALLTCRAFARRKPVDRQSWRIYLRASGVQAICEAPRIGLDFDPASFARDPRIASLNWNRPRSA